MLNKENATQDPQLYRVFIYILLFAAIIAVFYLFKPFLAELIIAAILASVTFSIYERLSKLLFNKKKLAALIICFALLILVIAPVVQLIIYTAQQAPIAYNTLNQALSETDLLKGGVLEYLNIPEGSEEAFKGAIIDFSARISSWLSNLATLFVKNTSNFFISLIIILLGVFYFLIKGPAIKKQILFYSPLPKNYNLEIINTFRSVSRTTTLSLLVSAVAQGLLSALGFLVIGWPFLFIFFISAFLSMIPYMLGFFFIPIIIYLLAAGQIWQAIVIIVWNLIIVVNVEEIIRAYIIKEGSNVNMVFMLFAILGGIALFGFWGVFIGPLVAALTLSVLNIYGLEFSKQLDKNIKQ
jgi:predicted PurR-regulated permease PerM